jgi:hypothetical protein
MSLRSRINVWIKVGLIPLFTHNSHNLEVLGRRGIILSDANPMSGVFRYIDPPTPSPPGECVSPRLWCGGRTHSLGGERWGVKSSEDARHCSVLYIYNYFVSYAYPFWGQYLYFCSLNGCTFIFLLHRI